jgi:transposase
MFNYNYKLGCDAHKHFSLFAIRDPSGHIMDRVRINHYPGAIQSFLSKFPEGTSVALETVGNWYWIVDEIEASGCIPFLAHAHFAKKMMAHIHKTDKLDADGLATLLHNGTLPAVWIPSGDLRDERELPRTRMAFSKIRTMLKNRTHSTLAKYNLSLTKGSDIFATKWRPDLLDLFNQLPPETARCAQQQLELLDTVQDHIQRLEARILDRIKITPSIQLVQTVPGPARVLAIVIDRETGSIDRFPAAKNFTSYSGLVPKVSASAGRAHYGRLIKQCNTYLKWAFRVAPRRASKPPTSSSASGTTPTGAANTSFISMNAPNDVKDTPLPSVPRRAIWRKPPIGFLERVSPTGNPHTGARHGRNPCLAQPGTGPCLTWVRRDPRVDWAAPCERTHVSLRDA